MLSRPENRATSIHVMFVTYMLVRMWAILYSSHSSLIPRSFDLAVGITFLTSILIWNLTCISAQVHTHVDHASNNIFPSLTHVCNIAFQHATVVFMVQTFYTFMSLLCSCGTWGGRDAYSPTRATVRSSTAYSSAQMGSGWCPPAVIQQQRYKWGCWLSVGLGEGGGGMGIFVILLSLVCYKRLASLPDYSQHSESISEILSTCDCQRQTRAIPYVK